MTDLPTDTRPSQLWKQLPAERKAIAADAFWRDENALAERAEAMALIAQRIKFRLKSVQAMPIEKKTRQLISLPNISEMVVARLLVSYHLAHQRPMMGQFLDALGIKHEEGLIAEDEMEPPSADRLGAAARVLAGSYSGDDVALYFFTLLWQDPETWAGLSDLPEIRDRFRDASSRPA
jgi:hypothetical protein